MEIDNPLPPVLDPEDIANFVADSLNQGGSGDASERPPKQSGSYRVPAPQGFKVIASTALSYGGAAVTVQWLDIDKTVFPIKGYRIYYARTNTTQAPSLAGQATASPCVVEIGSIQANTKITLWLQPFVASGQDRPLEACPTCTVTLPDPIFSLTMNDLLSGDSTTMKIANNLPSGVSGTTTGFGTIDNVTGQEANLCPGFIEFHNGNGKPVASMACLTTGAGAPGILRLFDGTGLNSLLGVGERVEIRGDTGKIKLHDGITELDFVSTPITPAAPGVIVGYVRVIINGTPYGIPYYA